MSTQTNEVPKGFECFDHYSTRVFIKYKQPVNGYTVKAMWFPTDKAICRNGKVFPMTLCDVKTLGKAVLFFEKKDTSFYVNVDIYSDIALDDKYKDKDYTFRNNEVLTTDNGYFRFKDVDFDGEEELVIFTWEMSQKDRSYLQVYKISSNSAKLMTEPPFDRIDQHTYLNDKTKTITLLLRGYGGHGELRSYRLNELRYPTAENLRYERDKTQRYWDCYQVIDALNYVPIMYQRTLNHFKAISETDLDQFDFGDNVWDDPLIAQDYLQ